MGIAAAALAAWLTACGTPAPEAEPAPTTPGCATAFDAIVASLEELHAEAGRAAPNPPDRADWIAACEALGLPEPALHCLEPLHAAAQPDACADAMNGVDRTSLDQPFLDAMLPPQGAPRE